MNQKLEIQKIKVNNGQELIAKAREYKNSGGEWKLRERYLEMPFKSIGKRKNKLGWGIIISNGKQTVDILSSESNLDYKDFIEKDLISFDEINVRTELHQLFPEVKFAHPDSGGNEKLNNTTHKELKKGNEDYILHRYLVAESSWHLKQILGHYVRENETKIYQSSNPHFSGWVEIIDGQDGNVYLYVGEKNGNGGREIKIGIEKNEYENSKGSKYDNTLEQLEGFWSLFTIDRPRTPTETKEYYSGTGGLEENWQTVNKFWEKTCRWTLEQLRNDLAKGQEFWDNEPNEEIRAREIRAINRKIAQINNRLEDMKKNHPDWYNNYDKICSDCGNKMCCHYEGGQPCGKSKSNSPLHNNSEGENNNQSLTPPQPSPKNNQLTDTEKSQIRQYLIKNGISKISLENGKLVIEYSENNKKTITNEDQELKSYHRIIKKLPNQSLSLTELQKNNTNNSSIPNKNNTIIYVGLTIGAFILGGIFVYFLVQKKKK